MSILNRFWKKDILIQKTIEIDDSLFNEIESLSETVFDASVNKLINACIDDLIEKENIKQSDKLNHKLCSKHSLLLRKSSLDNLEILKEEYHISIYKLINIAIDNVINEYQKEIRKESKK